MSKLCHSCIQHGRQMISMAKTQVRIKKEEEQYIQLISVLFIFTGK